MYQTNLEFNFTSESRSFCNECDFLKSRCLCDTLKSVSNKIHLIILQHPTETKHPLNTVRIMKKSFNEITIMSGEEFTNDLMLNPLLCDPKNTVALLYPKDDSVVLDKAFTTDSLTHLILIDGTWRKAKKIYMLSKNLHLIPSLSLTPPETSEYKIRKSPTSSSLSTIEAAVAALSILEPTLDTLAATKSFRKMIDTQIEKMGRVVYQKNYLDKKKE